MKKFVSLISLLIIIVVCITAPVEARDVSAETEMAYTLKNLGLFKGVSDTNFDLERAPSRTESIVMLIRVLGKESEALSQNWYHPFWDVPEWADQYVGYAYTTGLTNGVSDTEFGSGTASAAMYITFVLRALGYSDTNGADFTWDNPFSLASSIGIVDSSVNINMFWRADVVTVSYLALPVYLKDTDISLAEKLIGMGCFTEDQYQWYYKSTVSVPAQQTQVPVQTIDSNPSAKLTAEDIYEKCSPAVFYIKVYDLNQNIFATGSGFFISSSGIAVTNYHVIDTACDAYILLAGTNEVRRVIGVYDYSREEDWAILQIEGSGYTYLETSTSIPKSGSKIYAIGSPRGLDNTISEGIVSNANRDDTYIQITAPISHGSSGGALINEYGEVIGITSAIYETGENLGFARPISVIANADTTQYTSLEDIYFYEAVDSKTSQELLFETLVLYMDTYYDEEDNGIYYIYDDYDNGDGTFDSFTMGCYVYNPTGLGVTFESKNSDVYTTTTVVFTPYSTTYNVSISYGYINSTYQSMGQASTKVDAEYFTGNNTFGFYNEVGDWHGTENSIANGMLSEIIDYMNFILQDTEYSMADFGFVNFD